MSDNMGKCNEGSRNTMISSRIMQESFRIKSADTRENGTKYCSAVIHKSWHGTMSDNADKSGIESDNAA